MWHSQGMDTLTFLLTAACAAGALKSVVPVRAGTVVGVPSFVPSFEVASIRIRAGR